ncbi:unnamed protein product [Thelazia callipaeda]|uniref:Reverse transcriptase Ty1/copia-type domain-containing protein n=1 Tax=Thelazia callipaeda TaxID=103827 RepID=A0A0N5DAF4_THECL|nr:unnamed protein product [Thelazia callipaeda]
MEVNGGNTDLSISNINRIGIGCKRRQNGREDETNKEKEDYSAWHECSERKAYYKMRWKTKRVLLCGRTVLISKVWEEIRIVGKVQGEKVQEVDGIEIRHHDNQLFTTLYDGEIANFGAKNTDGSCKVIALFQCCSLYVIELYISLPKVKVRTAREIHVAKDLELLIAEEDIMKTTDGEVQKFLEIVGLKMNPTKCATNTEACAIEVYS